jgi:hypothetical protein
MQTNFASILNTFKALLDFVWTTGAPLVYDTKLSSFHGDMEHMLTHCFRLFSLQLIYQC